MTATADNAKEQRSGPLRALARRRPLLPIAFGVFLYSTGPVLVQASDVSGPVFSFWRLWFGAAVLGAATAVDARRRGSWPHGNAWRWAVGAGAAFGVHQLLLFSAVKATTVADVTLVNTMSPVVTAVLAVPMFGERPGRGFHLWSLVAMLGAGVVVFGASSGPSGNPVGMLLASGNVFAFAMFFLLSKRSRDHLPVLAFLFGVVVVAALLVSGYVTVSSEAAGSARSLDLVYAGIVAAGPGFFGHLVMTWPLRWVPANVPPVMRLGIPVLAALWAWWFLGEPISWWHLAGGVVVLTGVAGAVLSPSGRELVASETPHEQGPT